MTDYRIPQPVQDVMTSLEKAGFEAFAVGGCVRDLLAEHEPKDWDITTNARPEQVQALFPDSFYENDFGTVGVKTVPFLPHGAVDREHDVVEVTTYRTEANYSDRRRPDEVAFVTTLEEDLARRDFTVNAMALGRRDGSIGLVDPYDGQGDLARRLIRAVGDPTARFGEDALRLLRAVRFAARFGFTVEDATMAALCAQAPLLAHVSTERIRDEFSQVVMSRNAEHGMEMLRETGLLAYIIPELLEGVGCTQNLHHVYTVWEHNVKALATCPSDKLSVRLAALLHDVAKPRTKRGDGKYATFYNHDHVGARMTHKILTRLRYPTKVIDHAALLVDQHLFYYNTDEVTEAAVRRIIKRVGLENIRDLMDVRIGDRLGSGVPKAKPYKLRHFEYMVEKVSKDAVNVKMLALNGDIMIREMGFQPGPKIGAILDTLLAEVIDDASRNTREYLTARARELDTEDLETLRSAAKKRIANQRAADEKEMKDKYWVK